jgi:hypothetical protein
MMDFVIKVLRRNQAKGEDAVYEEVFSDQFSKLKHVMVVDKDSANGMVELYLD